MAQIDGINFSNIQQRPAFPVAGVWTHNDNIDNNGNYNYDGGKSVMALDIDWCGAQLEFPADLGGTQTIQTTGQLMNTIKWTSMKL